MPYDNTQNIQSLTAQGAMVGNSRGTQRAGRSFPHEDSLGSDKSGDSTPSPYSLRTSGGSGRSGGIGGHRGPPQIVGGRKGGSVSSSEEEGLCISPDTAVSRSGGETFRSFQVS